MNRKDKKKEAVAQAPSDEKLHKKSAFNRIVGSGFLYGLHSIKHHHQTCATASFLDYLSGESSLSQKIKNIRNYIKKILKMA